MEKRSNSKKHGNGNMRRGEGQRVGGTPAEKVALRKSLERLSSVAPPHRSHRDVGFLNSVLAEVGEEP